MPINNAKLVVLEWVWGFLVHLASSGEPLPPASQNHFNH